MNAPRKFRVWDGEEMHEPPHNFHLGGEGGVWLQEYGHDESGAVDQPETIEVMLSTGLTDAEDTEIWEGDIIQSNQSVCLVRWDEKHTEFKIDGQFKLLGKFSHNLGGYHANSNTRVIGNRYEDPSLLESKDHTP